MESKKISTTAKVVISVYNIILFATVWCLYYNSYAFQKFANYGLIVSIVIYCLVYFALCQLYRSFKIASSSIAATVLSQFISFGIADALLYAVCCLAGNYLVNIIPGAITVLVQLAGTLLLVFCFKQLIIRIVPAKGTILVYGENISEQEARDYRDKLYIKYKHLFDIQLMEKESDDICNIIGDKEKYNTIMLYEVSCKRKGDIIKHCIKRKQNIYFTPSIEDILIANCETKHLLDTPIMKYEYVYANTLSSMAKRLIDIVVSLFTIVVTSPFMLITALAIKIEDGGPVLYKQKRCTFNCKEFNIYKFRSMVPDADKDGFKPCTVNDDRITKVGRFIRKVRIDELPQLFNILSGQMSLVGPRPERVEHVVAYTSKLPEFALRTRVKAGLTGYAQIYGKYNTTAYDKLRLDLMYIENQSLILDFKLILLTIKVIFVPESTEGFEESKSKAIAENGYAKVKDEVAVTKEKG